MRTSRFTEAQITGTADLRDVPEARAESGDVLQAQG